MGKNLTAQVRGSPTPPTQSQYSFVTVATTRLGPLAITIDLYNTGPLQYQVPDIDYHRWQTKSWLESEPQVFPKVFGARIFGDEGLYDAGIFHVRIMS
jgi:hypothetical protein